jgi:cytochrome c
MKKNNKKILVTACFLATILVGCQGQPFTEPPIHPNQNMDFNSAFKAQEENTFFEDGRAMRSLVPGTIARGNLKESSELHEGKLESGEYVKKNPLPITKEFVTRGKERYNIYCTICHDPTGAGKGMVVSRGMLPPPNFHEARMQEMPEGQIYHAIHKGVNGNMPSYAYAIPVEDRWAIVAYVRTLQLSRKAKIDQVPSEISVEKGWKK